MMLSKTVIQVHVRWMIKRDIPEVLGISDQSYEFPWSEKKLIYYLRRRNCIGLVAEYQEQVAGFMLYELYHTWLHVSNFAVAAECRRCSVGRQIIVKLINRQPPKRHNRIRIEVREGNLAAQLFLRQIGFRAVNILPDWYEDNNEDAYLMQYSRQTDDT